MTATLKRGSTRTNAMDDGVVTPAAIATDAIDADALAADAIAEIVAAILAALPEGAQPTLTHKSITFTGAAGLGLVGNVPLFTVTGEVLIQAIVPYVVDDLTEAGQGSTLALGVTNATTLFIGATLVVNLDTGEFWTEPTGAGVADSGITVPAALKDAAISSNIVGTVAVQNCDGGTLRFDVYWRPLSASATVVAV